ncbi:hypothetical protein D9M69_626740 [compost metagenome]
MNFGSERINAFMNQVFCTLLHLEHIFTEYIADSESEAHLRQGTVLPGFTIQHFGPNIFMTAAAMHFGQGFSG